METMWKARISTAAQVEVWDFSDTGPVSPIGLFQLLSDKPAGQQFHFRIQWVYITLLPLVFQCKSTIFDGIPPWIISTLICTVS